jgi:hypothetical protein
MMNTGRDEMLRRPMAPTPTTQLVNGSLYSASGETFSIDIFDEYGRLKRVVAVTTDRVTITEREADSTSVSFESRTRGGAAAGGAGPGLSATIKGQLLDSTRWHPAIASMLVANDGSIAVRREDIARQLARGGDAAQMDSIVFDIVGSDGVFRGRVLLPRQGVTPMYFTGSDIYTVEIAGAITVTPVPGSSDAASLERANRLAQARGRSPSTTINREYQRLVRYTLR